MVTKKGCWNCKQLQYFEADFEETGGSGYFCNKRDFEDFKRFPCNRKLKCFEKKVI